MWTVVFLIRNKQTRKETKKWIKKNSQVFSGGTGSKESTCNAGDLGSIPGLRSPGKGNGYPLQNSCLENLMDRGTWQAIVHGIAESQTRLNDFHILFFIVGVSIYIPTNCVGGLPSLHTLSSIDCLCGFLMIVILAGERWYHIVLICISVININVEHLFMYLLLSVYLGEMSYVFCPFFEWIVCFDAAKCHKLFINFGD